MKTLFRRIQRITGYLTTPGRENKGKKAEIKDRVKHIGEWKLTVSGFNEEALEKTKEKLDKWNGK